MLLITSVDELVADANIDKRILRSIDGWVISCGNLLRLHACMHAFMIRDSSRYVLWLVKCFRDTRALVQYEAPTVDFEAGKSQQGVRGVVVPG